MGISPTSMTDLATIVSQRFAVDAADEAPRAAVPEQTWDDQWSRFAPSVADRDERSIVTSLSSLERRFASFTQTLRREFSSLERQFSAMLRSLMGRSSTTPRARGPEPSLARSGRNCVSPYDGLIRRAANRHEIDPALIRAVIRCESAFRPNAVSKAGAVGLMQLMPDTAKELGVADPFDPAQNIEGGTSLLRSLLDRYGGRIDLAVAAYNAGPAAVDKHGAVPPYAETRAYVQSVMASYRAAALESPSASAEQE